MNLFEIKYDYSALLHFINEVELILINLTENRDDLLEIQKNKDMLLIIKKYLTKERNFKIEELETTNLDIFFGNTRYKVYNDSMKLEMDFSMVDINLRLVGLDDLKSEKEISDMKKKFEKEVALLLDRLSKTDFKIRDMRYVEELENVKYALNKKEDKEPIKEDKDTEDNTWWTKNTVNYPRLKSEASKA